MTEHQPNPELAEARHRYHILRAAVADYHYHVRVKGGRVVEKIHGANCELITGYKPEEYAADPELWVHIVWEEDRPVIERQTAEILAEQPAPAQWESVHRLADRLKEANADLRLHSFTGGHDPASWAEELPIALPWLLGTQPTLA